MTRRARFLALLVFALLSLPREVFAKDSADAFMSVTFGLSSTRTQKRMEQSGAEAADFVRSGRLTMKGLFESLPSIFVFGFHAKHGLNHKTAYIASSGNPNSDRAFYEALREAYNIGFGTTDEKMSENLRAKGKLIYRSSWKPNKDTIISLTYNPEAKNRFPGESPGDYPIHISYNYLKWTTQ